MFSNFQLQLALLFYAKWFCKIFFCYIHWYYQVLEINAL